MKIFWYFVGGYFTLGTINYIHIYNRFKHNNNFLENLDTENDTEKNDTELLLVDI